MEGPIPWVSPLVVIPKKNGDVRCVLICVCQTKLFIDRHPSLTSDNLVDAVQRFSLSLIRLPSVVTSSRSDDIISFGETRQEHDQALHAVLQQFADSGLTISPEKCELHKDLLAFFGLVFSADGVSPDSAKVKAIHDARPPKSVGEVRSFLSMITYCAKFIPNFSDVTRELKTSNFCGKRSTAEHFRKSRNC